MTYFRQSCLCGLAGGFLGRGCDQRGLQGEVNDAVLLVDVQNAALDMRARLCLSLDLQRARNSQVSNTWFLREFGKNHIVFHNTYKDLLCRRVFSKNHIVFHNTNKDLLCRRVFSEETLITSGAWRVYPCALKP